MKEVKPSPDYKMIQLLKLDKLFFAKTRSRMRTTIAFSRQNDAGSRVRTTSYGENFDLAVVFVLESKGL